MLSRLAVSERWRVLLIFDQSRQGLHGPEEAAAFRRLARISGRRRRRISAALVLMVALPALAEEDLDRFGAAVAELQRAIGDYFAPVQGARFMSRSVAAVLAWLEGRSGIAERGAESRGRLASAWSAEAERRGVAGGGAAALAGGLRAHLRAQPRAQPRRRHRGHAEPRAEAAA